jgi:hypothetical protein
MSSGCVLAMPLRKTVIYRTGILSHIDFIGRYKRVEGEWLVA